VTAIFPSTGGPSPSVFTIPAGEEFLPKLAQAVFDACKHDSDPFALADALILLPTRRAARALSDAFLAASGGTALLMPRIRTLGDLPAEDVSSQFAQTGLAGGGLDLVPVNAQSRLFQLANLLKARNAAAGWGNDPVATLAAARALADLLDRAELGASGPKGFNWGRLASLVEDREMARHWELSVDFLKIITEAWPAILAATGQCDPGHAERLGLEQLAARWKAAPPDHPVIIAGSTGSVLATRALMAVVSRLPKGAVVLPGVDLGMAESAWLSASADDQHPQRTMSLSLAAMGVERSKLKVWPGCDTAGPMALRRMVLNEALTPKEATSDWPQRIGELREEFGQDALARGLDGLTLISADNEEAEAQLIALAMREVLEHPEGTAALVSADQLLARRVAAKLKRWDITVNVSAGEPLSLSATGMYIRLVAAWIEDPACPVRLQALLGHPLVSLGLAQDALATSRDGLDRGFLRGPRLATSLADFEAKVRATTDPMVLARVACGIEPVGDLLAALQKALRAGLDGAGLDEALTKAPPIEAPLPELLTAVMVIAETLAEEAGVSSEISRVWQGPAGEAAAIALSSLRDHSAPLGAVPVSGLERLVSSLLRGQVVRADDTHPRLAILGPLEARLLSFDTVILGGLNEGVWPGKPSHDPFLAPQMLGALDIDPPERRTGLSAHDFAQMAAQPRVIITRSSRQGDGPAVESRWLWRLRTLADGAGIVPDRGESLTSLAAALEPQRLFDPNRACPQPRPPVDVRNPKRVAVTQVETWVRDPYKFYARQLLKLYALDPLDAPIGSGLRGEAYHAVAEVIPTWSDLSVPAALERARSALVAELLKRGSSRIDAQAEAARGERSLRFVLDMEVRSRAAGAVTLVEQLVEASVETALGPISLTARVDRMEMFGDGSVNIIDFKTGTPATQKEALSFYSSQLTLTALILETSAISVKTPTKTVSLKKALPLSLQYVKLGSKPKLTTLEGGQEKVTMEALGERTRRKFATLCTKFADPDRAYLFQPSVKHRHKSKTYVDPYVHLARADEWGDALGEDA
jgi:ATP-dependent helicase/nuclease subunit B